jgi:hypothetical protein
MIYIQCENIYTIGFSQNIGYIFTLNINHVKKTLKFCEISEEDKWKVNFVKEIVDVKQNILQIDNNLMKTSELDDILSYITSC